jgi:SAM-dependent methyltransferase
MYNSTFFDEVARGTRESAQVVVPMLNELVRPASVLDVGCATGTWLAEWSRAGATDVLGIDGDYVDRSALQIPAGNFAPVDLQQPFSLGRTFDLVQTLEVAEHLSAARADAFVESLARHGDVILFSAAIPGQGGTHHVNEQWPSYWAEKFERAGYTAYDLVRPRIWHDTRVQFWYRQNMLLFARGRVFDGAAARLDLVHPELWQSGASYRHLLRSLTATAAGLLRGRLGGRRPGS